MFTSESVNEGHPDKLADQCSDAIVDACFAQDPDSHVACETCTGTGFVMVFGEITTKAVVDYEQVVECVGAASWWSCDAAVARTTTTDAGWVSLCDTCATGTGAKSGSLTSTALVRTRRTDRL